MPQLLCQFALKEQMSTIFLQVVTDRASHWNFHTTANKITSKQVAIMGKPPEEVFNFV
jgi:hypothetical protein